MCATNYSPVLNEVPTVSHEQINQHLSNWTDRESTAEAMIPLIGRLYRKNNVVTSVYGRAIINQSVIDIIRAHRFVRQVENNELSVHDTLPILQEMDKLELGRAHVDIGKLAVKFKEEGDRKSTRLNSSHVRISYAVFC